MPKAPSARRYARAAFELARDSGQVEAWSADLARAQEMLQAQDLLEYLEYPKLTVAQKVDIIRSSMTGLHPLVVSLLCLLASRKRIGLLPGLREEYQALADAHEGRVRAAVTTAVPMEPEQVQRIKAQLEGMVGQEVIIASRVDPELLGGVMARVGDRVMDGTLRGRLVALKRHLAEVRG
ncbi:MAG: F0F1 ATP synthase subunit delta [Chloroflexi bacterium]|nr:F0F1 ATP synthase subunit delta [Chloroflexota bacterium]